MSATPFADPPELLIVDDHPLIREGLASTLGAAGWRCTTAATAADARHRLGFAVRYAAVLADYRLPDGDGLALLAQVQVLLPQAACVLMSGADDKRLAARAKLQGLRGFISKSLEPAQIVQALHSVLAGGMCFSLQAGQRETELTERQTEVLQLVGEGLTSKEIARRLGLSERTVKDHLTLIFVRLNVGSRAEAVSRAGALGLIALG